MRRILDFLKSEIGIICTGVVLLASSILFERFVSGIVTVIFYSLTLIAVGAKVFVSAIRGILRRDLLDEQFLMSIASIGAFVLGDYKEGVAVMLFYLVGEYFQHKAVQKSRASIKNLINICPDEARVISDGGEELLDAEDVDVGAKILIRAGERVPIDAIVIEGRADVDTSALTGESLPIFVDVGDELKSGSIVLDGVIIARTVREFSESTASKILELVENANERKSKTENFITSFSRVYTPCVVILAILLATVPSIFKLTEWNESVYRALTFLVISCPCALVISVPMAFFGGIGAAASQGILFKGGNVFSSLAKAKTFAFDKTGTLTNGDFSVTEVCAIGVSEEELLNLAATVEKNSNHPIANALKARGKILDGAQGFEEISGRGIAAYINGERVSVGNAAMMSENGVEIPHDQTAKTVFVSRGNSFIGAIKLIDALKPEGKDTIEKLYRLGVEKSVILSGDKRENVTRVATKLGINDVYSDLLPDEKYAKLDEISNDGAVVYVGDGINDAPSLVRADVGIAMGAIGSDIAIESADVVIMADNLDRLPKAIKISRKTINIAKQNIVFALGVKLAILLLGALGIANMWLAVFADVGVAVLAILNSMRTLIRR